MAENLTPQPDTDTDINRRTLRRFVYLMSIALAVSIVLASICKVRPLLSANDRSRWCTIWSLVERGTYRIDEITTKRRWNTIDKVRHEGHFYSSKPALLPTLLAGIYALIKSLTGFNLLENTSLITRWMLIIVNLVPMVIAWIVFTRIAERYARTDTTRIFLVVAAVSATFLTTFLITVNNHTVAATSVILALYPAMRIVADGSTRQWHFVVAGFFAAFACTNDLPAALFTVAIFGLLFHRAPKSTLLYFLPAALVPIAGFFLTTYLSTGGWRPFHTYYGTEKYLYVHEGVPSYWMNPKGIDNISEPTGVYLLHCTVGHHGIFSLSPIFLLTVVAWLRIRRWQQFPLRTFLWLGLGLTLATLGFYLTRTANYNYGGNTAGLRWLFWLIPFWLIAMIPVLDAWGDRGWFRVLLAALLAVSVFSAAWALDNPWQQPWLFRLMESWQWIDYG